MNIPKVSIIIPVYNGSNYLSEAIDSALAQTYANIEVIVINDGSNDHGKTRQIALSYGDKIRSFEKENGGVASALNFGVSVMTGEYFSWLSHDDLYFENKIEAQMNWYMNNDDVILYSDFELVDENGTYLQTIDLSESSYLDFRVWITLKSSLNGCTLMIPRKCFGQCGLFDENLKTTQDYDLWFRMAEIFRFERVPVVTVKSRQHDQQGSKAMNKIAVKECNLMVIKFYFALLGDEKTHLEPEQFAFCFFKRGFFLASYVVYSNKYNSTRHSHCLIRTKFLLYKYRSLLMILLKHRFLYDQIREMSASK